MILSVHHVQIIVPRGAEDKAREFYCRVLGLTEISKPDALKDRGGFWLGVGDRQVHVGVEDSIAANRGKAHVAYLVDDIEASKARLREHEIEITDGIPIPGYSRFEFRDPFGNRVEFLQALNR